MHCCVGQSQDSDPASPEILVAHFVIALLLPMLAAVDLDYQPCCMAVEIHDVWCERLLSSEMGAKSITAKLWPNYAFFGSHVLA